MSDTLDPFMIRAHVPNFEACVADYRAASEATRSTLRSQLCVAYGEHADERLDLFFPAETLRTSSAQLRPVHMFVHGGYWRAFSKDDYSFVADSIVAAGAIAAIVEYSLMPAARMATLVDQVRRAARWLAENAASFGGDPTRFSASGHSAGAHLASYLACREPGEGEPASRSMDNVLLVSGLYDLEPVAQSFLQPEVRLTAEEIARWSPLRAAPAPRARVRIAYGAGETRPFVEQAAAFALHVSEAGGQSELHSLTGQDHMTVVRALGQPGSETADLMTRTILASGER